jgi:hypothetical protein
LKIKNRKLTCVFVLLFPAFAQVCVCEAVTSKVTRHSSSRDFLKGEVNDVVIGSRGTIQLGRRAEALVKQFGGVWSINSIVVSGDTVYIGTSPNGGVYAFSTGKLKKIYSAPLARGPKTRDGNEPNDTNAVESERHLANEHIFAMQPDVSGRLLVGISGRRCALYRLEGGEMKVLFEPNDANYIFAITTDLAGDIYLGTGPQGKIYRLDSLGKKPELVVDTPDKNILSMTQGPDGFIYAGSDTRGLVYRIDPRTKDARVLYDSDQQEITALLFSGADLYAAATTAEAVRAEMRFAAQAPPPGKPEQQPDEEEPPDGDSGDGSTALTAGGLKLQIANTKETSDEQPPERKTPPARPPRPARASYLYKITKEGFVTDIFSETAVLFCLAESHRELLVGTGNNAQLFCVDPNSEEQSIIYEDKHASQLTAASVSGDDIYIGTANPAKLIKLGNVFSSEGTYTSDLVDAGQPAKWGKLQIEAEIPRDCNVLVACRSGNVKDINDPSFSKWTALQDVTGPVQLDCPAGRFCQYKLVLRGNEKVTPVVREVAVATTVPNLAPRVESVSVARVEGGGKSPDKIGGAPGFKISYDVKDDNGDKLIYKIDFRKVGRAGWIEMKDNLESGSFEWDGRTVEDGRYEIRVTAGDERSNTPDTKMTGSRVSDPVVVDNTGPVVKSHTIKKTDKTVTLKMNVDDELSAIGKVEYTVDSDANWMGVVPDDLVYDTTSEDFTILVEKLTAGQHVIALRLADDVGNTTYKTFDVNIE